MVLGGLWHGAAWTFVFWGAFHGVGQVVGRLPADSSAQRGLPEPADDAGPRVGTALVTFHLVCLGWVFFRADSLSTAFSLLGRLFTGWGASTALVTPLVVPGRSRSCWPCSTRRTQRPTGSWIASRVSGRSRWARSSPSSLFIITTLGPQGVAPFIYFQF